MSSLKLELLCTKVLQKMSGQVLYQLSGEHFLGEGITVNPVLSDHFKRTQKMVCNTDYCLMQVKSIAESILQYFRPSLSYHLPLRPLFCIFLSGRLRQVLLYLPIFPSNPTKGNLEINPFKPKELSYLYG